MSLSTIFINVSAKIDNGFVTYPLNISNILAYPPLAERTDDVNTRIDLNAPFSERGYNYSGGTYGESTVYTALFVKETPEEIATLIETAQTEHIAKIKKNGLAMIL